MNTGTILVELIFRGSNPASNVAFLRELLPKAENMHFIFPEVDFPEDMDEVLQLITSSSYVDLSIGTNCLDLGGKTVPHVFVNVGKTDDKIEVLFFFDLRDVMETTLKLNTDYLRTWSEVFQKTHQFEYVICQMDNAGPDEYYFDSNGTGKLYDNL